MLYASGASEKISVALLFFSENSQDSTRLVHLVVKCAIMVIESSCILR